MHVLLCKDILKFVIIWIQNKTNEKPAVMSLNVTVYVMQQCFEGCKISKGKRNNRLPAQFKAAESRVNLSLLLQQHTLHSASAPGCAPDLFQSCCLSICLLSFSC